LWKTMWLLFQILSSWKSSVWKCALLCSTSIQNWLLTL
jgi:hypothetical protein